MKKFSKPFRIAVFFAAIVIMMATCSTTGGGGSKNGAGRGSDKNTLSGTAMADKDGELQFSFILAKSDFEAQYNPAWKYPTCDFTIDLPSPNDQFTLSKESSEKTITGLAPGQTVNWTATSTDKIVFADYVPVEMGLVMISED